MNIPILAAIILVIMLAIFFHRLFASLDEAERELNKKDKIIAGLRGERTIKEYEGHKVLKVDGKYKLYDEFGTHIDTYMGKADALEALKESPQYCACGGYRLHESSWCKDCI